MTSKPSRPGDGPGGEGARKAAPTLAARAPRWLPTVATVLAVAVFVAAGNWQRGRMEHKEALHEAIAAAASAQPVPLPGPGADLAALAFHNVWVQGRFDASRQILVDNRVRGGRAGYEVVAPLLLDDGRAILVKRGWVGAGSDRRILPDVPPPPGPVRVTGRVVVPSHGYLELRHEAPSGIVWQNLDPAKFTAASGLAVAGAVIEEAGPTAPADGLLREWPDPDTGIEKHRIYMVQWYAFAALAAGLWAWFHLRGRPKGAA